MTKDIIQAVKHLPEAYITPQIAAAAIEEGDIKLLDYLPLEYLTEKVVLQLVEKNQGYGSFDLERIPPGARTREVCEMAVDKETSNLVHVPEALRSHAMLMEVLSASTPDTSLLLLFPESVWDRAAALQCVRSGYRESSGYGYGYSRSRRHSYSLPSISGKLRKTQMLLSFVPNRIKDMKFYLGLFSKEARIPAEDVAKLMPARFKQHAYYRILARCDFKALPASKYSYDIFMEALKPGSDFSLYDVFHQKTPLAAKFFACMDNAMADAVVRRKASYFEYLPNQFLTSARLLLAIEHMSDSRGDSLIDTEKDSHLLTREVCKAFIVKDNSYPVFPAKVWNEAFVKHCLEHGTSLDWFGQMPPWLQTPQNTTYVLDRKEHMIQYVRPEFITLERAMDAYRHPGRRWSKDHCERRQKYIPQHYFSEFCETTGLPKEFFGGETTFSALRSERQSFRYCRLGDSYLGIYKRGEYSNSPVCLVMTRRTPTSARPQPIFDRPIGTFHNTWLEKMIADYDRTFIKPTVAKKLKGLQINPYYEVQRVAQHNGVDIYRNTFLGEPICYRAHDSNRVLIADTEQKLIEKIGTAAQAA